MVGTSTGDETGPATSDDDMTASVVPVEVAGEPAPARSDPLPLYPWPGVEETDRRIVAARLVGLEADGAGRAFVGVALTSDAPAAEAASAAVVEIPRAVIEPFRVRAVCYLVPASVVRAYQSRAPRG